MEPDANFIHGGGWVKRQISVRPRARFFGFQSVIWLLVSVCGAFPFLNGWPRSFGYLEWLCVGLLATQPVFVMLALYFWLTEKPRTITVLEPNPDYDLRKLY